MIVDVSVDRACGRSPRAWMPLTGIVLLALVVRLCSRELMTGTIDWEGAEYARLAQNLLIGRGYVGLDVPGTNLMFPPLFPYAIAAMSSMNLDLEGAARSLSIGAGALLPLPLYLIGRDLYRPAVGLVAALLTALHPLLVHFSATACSEPTYLLLLFSAVHLSIRALEKHTARAFALGGAALGAAYLTRIEALLIPPLVVLVAACQWRWVRDVGVRSAAWRVSLMPLAFVLVASPYVLWLHDKTGQWRFEAKSPLNVETLRRVVLLGQRVDDVHFGVNTDLSERGLWIKPSLPTIQAVTIRPVDLARVIAWRARSHLAYLAEKLAGRSFGTPIVAGLAVWGLLSGLRSRRAVAGQMLLVGIVAIAILQTFLIVFENVRFLLVLLPFILLWAAAGAVSLASRLAGLIAREGPGTAAVGGLVPALLLAVAMTAAYGVAHEEYALKTFDRSTRQIAEVGRSLAGGLSPRVRLAETSTAFSYYADAEWVPFPVCDSDTAARYLDKRGVEVVVIRESTIDRRPYLRSWVEQGIPGAAASLFSEGRLESGERYWIYRWPRRVAD